MGALDWVRQVAGDGDEVIGFDLGLPTESVWILHAMYERVEGDLGLSHDEVHNIELAAGTRERAVVGGADLDDKAWVPGGSLGWTTDPGPGWRRLRWSELAARLGEPMLLPGCGPFYGCFPTVRIDGRSWPASIQPPGEGSLDVQSWSRLVHILRSFSAVNTDCFAFYGLLSTPKWDKPHLYRGPSSCLGGLERLGYKSSPSNLWPDYQDWFLYTDYDLWGTRVWGSDDLLDALVSDRIIEAYFASEIMVPRSSSG
ncbi:MAG TPA: hypothetical protein VFU12_10560 [Glycomyces sp.]|nr:hypothetical protein [Glycomyces sp.]